MSLSLEREEASLPVITLRHPTTPRGPYPCHTRPRQTVYRGGGGVVQAGGLGYPTCTLRERLKANPRFKEAKPGEAVIIVGGE
jgi:hypothetical protein